MVVSGQGPSMYAENLHGQWVCTHCPNGATVQKRAARGTSTLLARGRGVAARLVISRSGRTSRPGDPRPNPQGAGADWPYLLLSTCACANNSTLRRETCKDKRARPPSCKDKRARPPCGDAVPGLISLEHGRSTARSEFTRPCAPLRSPASSGANGAGPLECTAGVTPAPPRTRDRRAEARTGPGRLCPRNGVAVPTNLPKCPACACGQKTTLRAPRWRSSRASALHKKDQSGSVAEGVTTRKATGDLTTRRWQATQRRQMVGYG